jgi:hypothetical protein
MPPHFQVWKAKVPSFNGSNPPGKKTVGHHHKPRERPQFYRGSFFSYFGYAGGRGESFGAGANLGNSGFGASVLFPPTEATVW